MEGKKRGWMDSVIIAMSALLGDFEEPRDGL